MNANESENRRPIASRQLGIFHSMARWFSNRKISPNVISIFSLLFALMGGVAIFYTKSTSGFEQGLLWFAGAAFVQLRLLANVLDGLVAEFSGKSSQIGELYNEIPDRLCDVAFLIALGFADGSSIQLGYAAAVLAVFVSYLRAIGAATAGRQVFNGILAKPQRMFLVTLICLWECLRPSNWEPDFLAYGWGVPAIGLLMICVGCVLTSITRLRIICKIIGSKS